MLEIYSSTIEITDFKLVVNDIRLKTGFYLLHGENGCGKTTFLNAIYNCKINSDFCGEPITIENRRNLISYITQSDFLLNELTALETLQLIYPKYDQGELNKYLDILNCHEIFDTKYQKLSGGEKQKVKLIINLLLNTPILLIDELDNHLDNETIDVIKSLLFEIKENKIIIMVSHNFDLYEDIIDENIYINEGQVASITYEDDESQSEYKYTNVVSGKFNVLNRYFRQLFILSTLGILLFSVIIMSYTSGFSYLFQIKQSYRNPFSNNSMIVAPPINSPFYDLLHEDYWFDTIPLLFNEDFYTALSSKSYITKIESIPNLQKAQNNITYQSGGKSYAFSSDSLTIDTSEIPNELTNEFERNDISYNTVITPEFNELYYSKDVQTNTPHMIYPLLLGEYPDDESNQLLIPIDVAIYLMQENNNYSPSSLIGANIDLNLNEVEGLDIVGEKNFSFEISGIYDSSKMSSNNYIVYAYSEQNPVSISNNCALNSGASFESCVYSRATYNYSDDEFLDLQKDDLLGKYDGFYIEVDTEEHLEQLTKEIREYDPYIYIDDSYVRDEESSNIAINSRFIKQLIRLIAMFIAFVIYLLLIFYYHLYKYKTVDEFLTQYDLKNEQYKAYISRVINNLKKISFGIILIITTSYLILENIDAIKLADVSVNSRFLFFTLLVAISLIALDLILIIIFRRIYEKK